MPSTREPCTCCNAGQLRRFISRKAQALTSSPAAAGSADRRPSVGSLLAAVSLGGVLAPLNSTMLAVALPDIRTQFEVGHAGVAWLVSSYLIAMAVTQPVAGRVSDQIGRARVFRWSLISFLVLSLLAAIAPTFLLLVFLRTGQAVCGAALIPAGLAMIRQAVPADRLGRVTGMNGGLLSLAAAIGPLLGALVLALGNWRWLFVVNVPVIALALVVQSRLTYREELRPQRLMVDWLGVALLTLFFVALTVSFNQSRSPGGYFVPILVATVLIAAAVVRRLLSSPAPVVEWRLFRNSSFAAATIHVLTSNFVMYATLLTVPFFVQEILGRGVSVSGIALGAMSVAMALLSPLSGRMGDAFGRRLPALMGAAVTSAGAALLLFSLSSDVPTWQLAAGLAVLGLGVGLGTGAATTAAIECAPRARSGAAAGASSMMRYVGSIAATGLVGVVLNTEMDIDAQIEVYRVIFAILVVVAIASVAAASRIHRFVDA